MKIACCAFIATFMVLPAIAQQPSELLGTWHCEDFDAEVGHLRSEMTIRENGTFTGFVEIDNERAWNFAGNWELNGNALTYTYTDSDLAEIQPGFVDKDTIVKLDRQSLHLLSLKGQSVVCTRKLSS
jgi:hypothetical protein